MSEAEMLERIVVALERIAEAVVPQTKNTTAALKILWPNGSQVAVSGPPSDVVPEKPPVRVRHD